MEAYIVHLAKDIRIVGQGYALKPYTFFFFIAAVLKIYQTNKEYIFCTNFIKMYTECNEHHLN